MKKNEQELKLLDGIIEEIKSKFQDGKLIPHSWFEKQFGLSKPNIKSFRTTNDYLEALGKYQFSYLGLTERLKSKILIDEKMCLKNERGDGFVVIEPQNQVEYGFKKGLKGIRKEVRSTKIIINNVMPVDHEQQARDNDLRAKWSKIESMSNGIKLTKTPLSI